MSRKFWIGVASADHMARGRSGGFMQVSHGKAAPLERIQPGDGVAYYSPSRIFGRKDAFQSFTAIGVVREGEPYRGDMGGGFLPIRRDVDWAEARSAPIAQLLERLELTSGKKNWGYAFRFGLLTVGETDFRIIARAMAADPAFGPAD